METLIRTVIVEDEQRGKRLLKSMVAEFCPEIEIVAEVDNVESAIHEIDNQRPDLIFLDINLFGHSAFTILDQLQHNTAEIIFTTAYDQYALDAFKHNAVGYLVKPIGPTELINAVEKVSKILAGKKLTVPKAHGKENNGKGKIALPTLQGLVMKDTDKIVYVAADGNYSRIFFNDGINMLISHPLGYYSDWLDEGEFFRIHKSYIINMGYVEKYIKGRGGHVVMPDKTLLPVASRRKDLFLEQLKVIGK